MDRPDERRVEERSELLPEEATAGSDDPRAQAEAILDESDERTERAVERRDDREPFETRPSEETVEPRDEG